MSAFIYNRSHTIETESLSTQLEQRILETIRVLAPEKQEAVLAFAESLQRGKDGSNNGLVDLASRGIGIEQAGELRSRLTTFAEDWNRPDMDAYDEL